MGWILLAGKDWQARALLRAQLLEEGLEVEAHETVREALASLESSTPLPALLVADLSASDGPLADAELLSAWTRQVPIWIIATRTLIIDKSLKGRGFEMILFRPVDVGELVEQIKRRLET
jgi:DNA-binding response OmpR family regulator